MHDLIYSVPHTCTYSVMQFTPVNYYNISYKNNGKNNCYDSSLCSVFFICIISALIHPPMLLMNERSFGTVSVVEVEFILCV